MLRSPFTFYRGSAGVMAADLARTPVSGIQVQVCGDCHLMNFGGFATPERRPIFDITTSPFGSTPRSGASARWSGIDAIGPFPSRSTSIQR
jgi:hypothetical protein